MICPECLGQRHVVPGVGPVYAFITCWTEYVAHRGIEECSYCDGTGEVSCCEGTERQLPEVDDDPSAA